MNEVSAVNQNGMGNSSRTMAIVVHTGGTRREMKVRVGKVKVTLFLRTGGYMASRKSVEDTEFSADKKEKDEQKIQRSTE